MSDQVPPAQQSRPSVAVVTWAAGGNLPPLLAAGSLLAARGHRVHVLTSAATRPWTERAGFETHSYGCGLEPGTEVAFERQAETMMATAAGPEIARDVYQMLLDTRARLAIVDCMLPAGLAAGQATGTPTASLVHFPYGLTRRQLVAGHGWTTDLRSLDATHRALGLAPVTDALTAWEAPDLLLVTAPAWFDLELDYPAHLIHAGPLGIRARPAPPRPGAPRILLSFSTTVMEGQLPAIQRASDAIATTGTRATLTLGPAIDSGMLRLPAGLEVDAWADHDALLAGCAALITHGGLGTTLRALAHGVPLLLLPLGRDQAFNAARVSDLGAGIRLAPDADPADIRSALDRLLHDPSFPNAAARLATRIAAEQPDRHAVEALERCARI